MPKVKVRVSPTGQVVVQAEGFAGPACQKATAPYIQALGVPTSETLTSEYYQATEQRSADVEVQE